MIVSPLPAHRLAPPPASEAAGVLWDGAAGLPEDVALKLVALLLLVLDLQPHGFLFLLRLLTQTIHQPLLPQSLLLPVKNTNISVLLPAAFTPPLSLLFIYLFDCKNMVCDH